MRNTYGRIAAVVSLCALGWVGAASAQNVFTYAGSGTSGYDGDGGSAVQASLSQPSDVTVDAAGNVHFIDYGNSRIRKVTPEGVITTEIEGVVTPWGIAVDSNGVVYLSQAGACNVLRMTPAGEFTTYGSSCGFSGDGGPASAAKMNIIRGLTLDGAGNLYVADASNNRIRKITPGGIISTVAGNGAGADCGDGGPATSACVWAPYDVAATPDGTLYIADYVNGRIRRVTSSGIIDTVPGGYIRTKYIAVDRSGNVLIGGSHGVAKLDSAGIYSVIAGTGTPGFSGDGGPAMAAMFNTTLGVFADAGGTLYVADSVNERIRKIPLSSSWSWSSDFDGDGWSDVLWRNLQSGANVVWPVADSRLQRSLTAQPNLDWEIVGQADFGGDGRSDVLWRNKTTGQNAIWKSGAAGTQQPIASISNLSWKVAGTGDFDGDLKGDILFRNESTGANVIWKSGNAATAQSVATLTDLNWRVAGVGDFNGDGIADIFWRKMTSGANMIWRSGKPGTAKLVMGVTDQAWQIVGVGDFDGDGRSDIFWRNSNSGANTIWRDGDSTKPRVVTALTDPAWRVAQVADFDGDRESDILWRNGSTTASSIWLSGRSTTPQGVSRMVLPWVVAH